MTRRQFEHQTRPQQLALIYEALVQTGFGGDNTPTEASGIITLRPSKRFERFTITGDSTIDFDTWLTGNKPSGVYYIVINFKDEIFHDVSFGSRWIKNSESEDFDGNAKTYIVRVVVIDGQHVLYDIHGELLVNESLLTDKAVFLADFGKATDTGHATVGNYVIAEAAQAILLGGGNNFPLGASSTITANLTILDAEIAAEKVFPALGHGDLVANELATFTIGGGASNIVPFGSLWEFSNVAPVGNDWKTNPNWPSGWVVVTAAPEEWTIDFTGKTGQDLVDTPAISIKFYLSSGISVYIWLNFDGVQDDPIAGDIGIDMFTESADNDNDLAQRFEGFINDPTYQTEWTAARVGSVVTITSVDPGPRTDAHQVNFSFPEGEIPIIITQQGTSGIDSPATNDGGNTFYLRQVVSPGTAFAAGTIGRIRMFCDDGCKLTIYGGPEGNQRLHHEFNVLYPSSDTTGAEYSVNTAADNGHIWTEEGMHTLLFDAAAIFNDSEASWVIAVELKKFPGATNISWDMELQAGTSTDYVPAITDPANLSSGWGMPLANHFPYVPSACRFYHEEIGTYIDLFVLNCGLVNGGNLNEEAGVSEFSAQHEWFKIALAASDRPYKVVMLYRPFVAPAAFAAGVDIRLKWPEFLHKGVLLLNGCSQQNWSIIHSSGLEIVDASLVGRPAVAQAALNGLTDGCTLKWFNNTDQCVAVIRASNEVLQVTFERCSDGAVLHTVLVEPY